MTSWRWKYRYARLLDDDRLEEWPNLFVERGVYKVNPARNLSPPAVAADHVLRQPGDDAGTVCEACARQTSTIFTMLATLLSNVEILSARDDTYEVAACYTVYQTDLEGQTRLFSVGQYRDVIANGDGDLKFREKIAVCDTFNIPNLLAIPL